MVQGANVHFHKLPSITVHWARNSRSQGERCPCVSTIPARECSQLLQGVYIPAKVYWVSMKNPWLPVRYGVMGVTVYSNSSTRAVTFKLPAVTLSLGPAMLLTLGVSLPPLREPCISHAPARLALVIVLPMECT